MTTVYLSIEQVLDLHALQLRTFGGATGLRDRGALESALARPAMTFAGDDLYPSLADKAAALMHSLTLNHPFVDGNKRVAAHAAIVFIEANGHVLGTTSDELVEIALALAAGQVQVEALAIWIRQRVRSVE